MKSIFTVTSLVGITMVAAISTLWAQDPAAGPSSVPSLPALPNPAPVPAENAQELEIELMRKAEIQELERVRDRLTSRSITGVRDLELVRANEELKRAYEVASRNQPSKLASAMQDYQTAEGDEAKETARQAIKAELSQEYDAFLEAQEKSIVELESRLAKLRELLARRTEAKDRLVELKLEMVISQADGLGWPSNSTPGVFGIVAPAFPGGGNYAVPSSPQALRTYTEQPFIAPSPNNDRRYNRPTANGDNRMSNQNNNDQPPGR